MKILNPRKLLGLLLVLSFQFSTIVAQDLKFLTLSQVETSDIKGGETDQFKVQIPQNQTAKIEIEQKNLSLNIKVFKPNGEKFIENAIDNSLSSINFILVSVIEAGEYRIEISPTDKNLKPSNYSIKLSEIRPIIANDQKFIDATNQIFQLVPAADVLNRTQKEANVRQAIEKYQQVLELSKIVSDKYLEARILLRMHFIYLQLTEYPKAMETAEQALAIWTELGSKGNQAVLLDKIGIVYNRLQNYKLAVESHEKALILAREAKSTAETFILTNLANVYDNLGNAEKAVEFHQQAINKQRELGLKGEEGRSLINLGLVLYRLGKYDKALESYNLASPILQNLGDKVAEASLLQNFGILYNRIGEPRRALNYYQQAFAMYQLIGDKRGQALSTSSIGTASERLGDFEKALESYQTAIKIYRELGNQSEAASLNSLGTLFFSLGEEELALGAYNESLKIRQRFNDRRGVATSLANIGAIYQNQNELTKARTNYEEALKLWREFKDKDNESRGLALIGAIERKDNNLIAAVKLFTEALEISRSINNLSSEASHLNNLGLTVEIQNEKNKALEYLTQSTLIYRNSENKRLLALNLYHQSRIKNDLNQLLDARKDIEEAISIIENLRERIPTQSLRSSFFASVQQYYELYIEILLKQHELEPAKGFDILAFEISERGRSRSLLELLQEARVDIRQGADEKLLQRETELQEILNQKALQRTQLLSGKFTPEQKEKANREISNISAELDNIRKQLRQQSPRYASLTQVSTLSIKEVQSLLDDKTVLLEYKLAKNKSYLWLITKTSVKVYTLLSRQDIENLAKNYYDAIISRNKTDEPQLTELAGKLNENLIKPIESQITGKRLAIVADGILQYIPFSTITEKNEMISLPSASVLGQLRQKSDKTMPAKTLAIFADAVFENNDPRLTNISQNSTKSIEMKRVLRDFNFGENLPRLLASREEARNISSLMTKDKLVLNTDFEANRENIINGNLENYQILHFATHGLLDTSRPELSSLVFSLYDQNGKVQDGFLRLNQIYNLNLNSDLVVLSACQTALGKDVKGEGLVGLTRGFMYAGAKRVLASLWKVDDAATAEFMKRFYQNLLVKKLSPVTALNQTQIEMKQIPRFKSPYFWAGFTLQGDWQ